MDRHAFDYHSIVEVRRLSTFFGTLEEVELETEGEEDLLQRPLSQNYMSEASSRGSPQHSSHRGPAMSARAIGQRLRGEHAASGPDDVNAVPFLTNAQNSLPRECHLAGSSSKTSES